MQAIATINHSLSDMQVMAESIARSGLFGMKSGDQALALMLVAQAEGMHPATITQDYDIIQGKACRKSHSVMARFQQTGGKVDWHELTDKVADATFSHPQGGALRMSWTWEQASSAKLTGKDNWKSYPRAMLRSRLIAEAIRAIYPAALGGMLLAEEAQDLPVDAPHVQAAAKHMGQAEIVALPTCSDELFEKRLLEWHKAIADGRATAAAVIAKASTKYSLTDEQKAAIHAKPAPAAVVNVSFAFVADALRKAQETDALDAAATLIGEVADAGQRTELLALYTSIAAQVEN